MTSSRARSLVLLAAWAVGLVSLGGGCARSRSGTAPPPVAPTKAPEPTPAGPGVTICYYGQACFTVTDSKGMRVAIDPYGEGTGYPPLSLTAAVCLVSHGHFDHNNTAAVSGSPEIIRTAGSHEVQGLKILGVTALHHAPGKDADRGEVVMFRWAMEGVTLLHCGDLGTALNADQISQLGSVDVLFVPVGGTYTIDAAQAVQVAQDVKARVIVPMHYKTDASAAKISVLKPVDEFLQTIPSTWLLSRLQERCVTLPKSEVTKEGAPVKVTVLNYR